MPQLAVVILNWNGIELLQKYIPSVVTHTANTTEIYVIDNASTDKSVAFLKDNYPQIKIIVNNENYGFAKGYNEGLKQIEAEYYCLLNSDVEVTPNWDISILSFMENNKDVAVCQPKLLSYLQKDEFEYAGAAGGFIDKYGYPFCRGSLFSTMEKDKGQYETNEIFWATGACMFVRSSIYHDLGGLDDDFFTHMEEIDFCWRVKSRGYKVVCCSDSYVFHYGGGSLAMGSPRKTFYNFRNNLIMLYKNLPSKRLFPVFFMRFIYDFIAALRFLLDSGVADCKAVFKAHISFYKSISSTKIKRKNIKQSITIGGIYQKNIMIQYFFFKKKKFTDLNTKDFS